MKKLMSFLLAGLMILSVTVSAAATGYSAPKEPVNLMPWLLVLGAVTVAMLMVCIIVGSSSPFSRKRRGAVGPFAAVIVYLATFLQVAALVFCCLIYLNTLKPNVPEDVQVMATEPSVQSTVAPTQATEETQPTQAPTEPTETEPPATEPPFEPAMSDSSNPENWEVTWEVLLNGEVLEEYNREEPISFGDGSEYFALPGIPTFRGNNYRDNATYGTAEITTGKITKVWSHKLGLFNGWSGCAWTGQPLVVQWDEETKQIMNLYEDKKEKEGLVEVIWAKLDGYIHFYDLDDGSKTRDPINVGVNFKGAGALDPRGYPIFYVGAGIRVGNKLQRMYAISLIDGEILWQHGNGDKDAIREWYAFDSSPLVDAETDTLIWPGENGLLYTVKLNTQYDKEAGTLTMEPDEPVKTRYTSMYSDEKTYDRYLGYEASAAIVENYLYISENGGLFQCVDLNTMGLVWAQDTMDDSNSTPLFEWSEDGKGYIYTAPSLHWTQEKHEGTISIYKLDALTGEIVWTHEMDCVTYDEISGGVQSSPLLGREGTDIDGMVIYMVGRSPGAWRGQLVALDKETGEVIWQFQTGNYAWSSPVALYTEEGKAYIFQADASGVCYLLDGATGKKIYTYDIDQTVEASPVVFNNMLLIGSRQGVYCFKIS